MWYQNTDEMTSTNDSTLILILKHINDLIWPTGILQKQRHCALNIFKNQKMWQTSVQKLWLKWMEMFLSNSRGQIRTCGNRNKSVSVNKNKRHNYLM